MKKEVIPLTEAVYYILLSLCSPNHGYGIMQDIGSITKERIKLGPGTLYGALNTLLKKKWIEALPNINEDRKKLYQITDLGKSVLIQEQKRLKELLLNGEKIIGDSNGN